MTLRPYLQNDLSARLESSLRSPGDSPQVLALLELTPELVLPLGSVVVELEVDLEHKSEWPGFEASQNFLEMVVPKKATAR